ELSQPGFIGEMFGFENAAILLVHDVGPVELIDDNLWGTAVCHGVHHIFYDEGSNIGRVCALVGGAVEDTAVFFISHMQPIGTTKSQGNAATTIYLSHLEMIAAT